MAHSLVAARKRGYQLGLHTAVLLLSTLHPALFRRLGSTRFDQITLALKALLAVTLSKAWVLSAGSADRIHPTLADECCCRPSRPRQIRF